MDVNTALEWVLENSATIVFSLSLIFGLSATGNFVYYNHLDKNRRLGYSEIGEEVIDVPHTVLEYIILWTGFAQAISAIVCAVFSVLHTMDELVIACSIFQFLTVYIAMSPTSVAPRYFVYLYLVAIINQLLICIKDSSEILVASQVLLGFNVGLFALQIINPVKNADYLSKQLFNGRSPSIEDLASPLSFVTFSWVEPLLSLGTTKHLEEKDLPSLSKQDEMNFIVSNWKKFRLDRKNSVIYDTIIFSLRYAIFQQLAAVISTILDFAKPFFINKLLNWIQQKKPEDSLMPGVYILLAMFLANCTRNVLYAHIYLNARHWGMQIRSVFVYEIFTKSLRRVSGNSDTKDKKSEKASHGRIVSLMSGDTNDIRYFITFIHTLIIDMPITITLSVAGLWYLMGPPAFAGLFVILITGPLSAVIMKRLYKIMKPQFIDRIIKAREDELNSRLKQVFTRMLLVLVEWGASVLVTFTSFMFYTVVAGHQLDAATAFTSITLLSMISDALSDISQTITQVLDIRVTIGRFNSFLEEEELDKYTDEHVNMPSESEIAIRNGEFTYRSVSNSENETTFTLRNVNIEFPTDRLTAVIGPTGSGKSSLLACLLGELKKLQGNYFISEAHLLPNTELQKSDLAYCPQTAWLMNGTIRENILFGEEYDEERYYKVAKACALLRDLQTLEGGDMTQIGEKGVNLSGGQKQRVSLARAAYSKAKIVILDDPLSAVDAPTARHLLTECILDLFSDRTVILVTHAVHLVLPHADRVVVMKNGSAFAQGTPLEIFNNPLVTEAIASDLDQHLTLTPAPEFSDDIPLKSVILDSHKERQATGTTKLSTYKSYAIAAGGVAFMLLMIFCFGFQTVADYLNSWWIKVWTDSYGNTESIALSIRGFNYTFEHPAHLSDDSTSFSNSFYYLSIYGLLGFLKLFAMILKFLMQFYGALRASRSMHNDLLAKVLGSPMRFFETTPVGRIINRFSTDMATIDKTVMNTSSRFIFTIFGAISRIVIVTFVTPPFLISLLLVIFYIRIGNHYLKSSREIKRIESVSYSPIYGQFGETLVGVSTIRAYGAEKQCAGWIESKVDDNHRASLYLFATGRWLAFRTSILSGFIVFCAGLSLIVSNVSAGWAGVALSFASQIVQMMSNAIQNQSSLEMAMNAVERVDEYSKLVQEVSSTPEDAKLPKQWPSDGAVHVSDLKVRYAPSLPDVLKGLQFSIAPKEKLGIVGRTGAGKSTLSLAFFRILPYSEGTIHIDGVDISKLGTHALRTNLTIIPQDPVLFEGTLRSNLDPLEQHSDEAIWDALRHTHVLESLQTAEGAKEGDIANISLDSEVAENGSNYSQGQRQLLCMARALLRSSKFIFMDEATASVDPETDAKIQQTIRSEFDATILTVAHRLKTIIDYDRVLVMDDGVVAEIGTPYELLQNQGLFHNMCKESGDYEYLIRTATEIHLKK
ncbi:hypothetical protein HDV01_005178 [Terramyces sp. JEL0728]|nr:hypothetical protein HDV01_005178 [Terramyces sp. JEL0728]